MISLKLLIPDCRLLIDADPMTPKAVLLTDPGNQSAISNQHSAISDSTSPLPAF
jgi:hypothetical protein